MSCASVTGVQTYALPITTTRVGRALVTSLRNASVAVGGIVASPCCSPRPAAPSRRHCRFGLPGSPLVGAAAHGLGTQGSNSRANRCAAVNTQAFPMLLGPAGAAAPPLPSRLDRTVLQGRGQPFPPSQAGAPRRRRPSPFQDTAPHPP